jgi:uncharacterized protein (DUF58 family)
VPRKTIGTEIDAELLARLPDLAARARAVARGVLPGTHPSVRRGPAAELVDRRSYVPGDDPRLIDWRVYARTRQLLVRRARRDADLPVHLVLDASASMGYASARAPRSKLDHAKLLALALGHLFLRAGDRVGLLVFSKTPVHALPPRSGSARRLGELAAVLERTEPAGTSDAARALRALRPAARRAGVVILLTDLLGAEGSGPEAALAEVRSLAALGHDVVLLVVHDPAELALDHEGTRLFIDPEDDRRRKVVDVDRARAGYRERIGAHHALARRLAHEARADLAIARTDGSLVAPIGEIYARRGHVRASRRGLA